MEKLRKISALLLVGLISVTVMAQEKKMLTLEDVIPGGETYHQFRPENIYGLQWWGDICVKPDMEDIKTIDPRTGKENVIATLEEVNKAITDGEEPYRLSHPLKPLQHFMNVTFPWMDKQIMVFRQSNYIVYYDFGQKKIINLFYLDSKAMNLDFCPENGYAAYTVGSNLFINNKGDDDKIINPVLTDDSADEQGIVYGQAVHRNEFGITKGTFWSPRGTYLAFYRMDQSMVSDYPLVDISQRIALLDNIKYPMAGMISHKVTIGVYNIATGKTVYLQAGDPTDRYFTNIAWSPDESKIYVIELNRDQNHSQLVCYDAGSGERETVLLEETHSKYVEPMHPILFVKGNDKQFIYQSQRNGFNHLYLYDTDGKLVKQLTSGNWLVQNVLGFDKDGKNLFFMSTEKSPMESHLYKVNLKLGKRTLITLQAGMHDVLVSASGAYAIDKYSSANIPRVIDIVDTNKGKVMQNLLTAKNPFEEYAMPIIETGTIKAADGVTDLYYRLIKPSDFDSNKKYPAIIYVYGGPHAQMIHNNFNWDARGWDIYMAQKGYIMFTLDNRGSENRGLDFENVTFRHLGVEEGKDQVKGAEFLKSLSYVDGDRIGVHGWSFGGHMTTSLLLRYPELFKVGVAGGPVIDWKYYEIMYGERYMDTPQANPAGYEECNLNNMAKNLKGHLLIIHDDNDHTCVLQHTLSFMKACIEARTYPDLFIYPGHDHNVKGRDRVHLHEKITRYFEDYLK